MIRKHTYNNTLWIELLTPSKEEVQKIMSEYNIDPIVAHEMTSPSPKSHIEVEDEFIYMVMHFPVFKHSHTNKGEFRQEIDFLLTKDFLLTVTYDSVDSLHKFSKELEVSSILKRNIERGTQSDLFFTMFSKIYNFLLDEIYYIEDRISDTEHKIFQGREKEMVFELSLIGRQVLDFKKIFVLHKPVLETLRDSSGTLLGNDFSKQTHEILNEYYRIRQMIKSSSESISELRETNDSLLATKQNEIIQILTAITFIIGPLTLITGVFTINSPNVPIVGTTEYDFLIILGIMLVATFSIYLYFKYKKWL